MSRAWLSLALTLALALSVHGAEPKVVKLWPGNAPGEKKNIGPEKYLETKKGQLDVKRLTNVSEPTISIYSPPKDKANGTVVIVAPGGRVLELLNLTQISLIVKVCPTLEAAAAAL